MVMVVMRQNLRRAARAGAAAPQRVADRDACSSSISATTSASPACRRTTARCASSSTSRRCWRGPRSASSATSARRARLADELGVDLRLPAHAAATVTRPARPGRAALRLALDRRLCQLPGLAMPCCMVATPDRANFGNMAERVSTDVWNGAPYAASAAGWIPPSRRRSAAPARSTRARSRRSDLTRCRLYSARDAADGGLKRWMIWRRAHVRE